MPLSKLADNFQQKYGCGHLIKKIKYFDNIIVQNN